MTDNVSSLPTLTRLTCALTGLSYLRTGTNTLDLRKLYIFVHGWACTASDYVSLLLALSGSERQQPGTVHIALDLPGHGCSPYCICPDPTVVDFATLVNQIRLELCACRPGAIETVLVGHSMGCRIALEAFTQQPDNVEGIVLIDGSWYGPSPRYKSYTKPMVDQLPLMMKTLTGMFGPLTPEDFKEQKYQQMRDIDLDYEFRLSEDYVRWDSERMEDALRVIGKGAEDATNETRLLIVQSTERHGAKRRSLKMGEEGPWMRLVRETVGEQHQGVIIEHCGHWPHVDKVEEVADAIMQLLDKK